MPYQRVTMTAEKLQEALSHAVRRPHKDVRKGDVIISPEAFKTPGRETNVNISRFAFLDCTGDITVGPWCMLSSRCRIYTHDHIHAGKKPLLEVQETFGVMWQDKHIGADVWIHDSAIVLYQATRIPDGVVIGAGAVLTKNPGAYEIWAGAPARKIGERTEMTDEAMMTHVREKGVSLTRPDKP